MLPCEKIEPSIPYYYAIILPKRYIPRTFNLPIMTLSLGPSCTIFSAPTLGRGNPLSGLMALVPLNN